MIGKLASWLQAAWRSDGAPVCFFATGTGRCGSMLLAQMLGTGTNVDCHHERSITTTVMKQAYYQADLSLLDPELKNNLFPVVETSRRAGKIYGECSAHLFLLLSRIHNQYGKRVRFVHLVRRPDTFAQSALARGFFDQKHPHALEHIRPPDSSPMGRCWPRLQPLEKCLWYWNEVNSHIIEDLRALPPELWRLQRLEDMSLETMRGLFDFLHIRGFDSVEPDVSELVRLRVNASPGLGDDRHLNPWSKPWSLPNYCEWNSEQRRSLSEFAGPLARTLYPAMEW
jgi:hypothetical protein